MPCTVLKKRGVKNASFLLAMYFPTLHHLSHVCYPPCVAFACLSTLHHITHVFLSTLHYVIHIYQPCIILSMYVPALYHLICININPTSSCPCPYQPCIMNDSSSLKSQVNQTKTYNKNTTSTFILTLLTSLQYREPGKDITQYC